MKTIKSRKGNYEYYLNYEPTERVYSFVIYVKIKSKKRKEELKSSREKLIDIEFRDISEVFDLLSSDRVEILKFMLKGMTNE
ncbi:hypothetical protein DCF83_18035 (plasmid) [Edwardsiella tarda]|uniref:hypothetical protein n=1 Tax=Edwardsiella tarda TaxID=636 RepID=UPI000D51FE8E|nr:hypothetical protein [Edwardsiella tarda]UCQ29619.1 hypothetical protein DCF83_18035 [Edwardsiella tarda]